MIHFARTRHPYDSYTDFWSLVLLSGFHVCFVDEIVMDAPGDIYVVSPMNGEWKPIVDNLTDCKGLKSLSREYRPTILQWNLERPSNGLYSYIHDNQALINEGYFDGVLVSDRRLAEDTGLIFMPMGSHAELGKPGDIAGKAYDVIHLSCYSNNRSFLFDHPSQPKSHIGPMTIANNGWGQARHENLQRTRFMLNVHQDGNPYIEPLRFALAAAYGLPIVSEPCLDTTPYGSPYVQYSLQSHMVDFVKEYLMPNYHHWYDVGMSMREVYTGPYSFKAFVEECLPRIVEERLK